jgi:acyl carrier protein
LPSSASEAPAQTSPASAPAAQDQATLERDLAGLFVQALNLEMAPADIDPEAPLFGDGLGLDSIDILEVALEVSHRYGFQLRSDDENNQQIFQSLRSLAAHVALHRTQ